MMAGFQALEEHHHLLKASRTKNVCFKQMQELKKETLTKVIFVSIPMLNTVLGANHNIQSKSTLADLAGTKARGRKCQWDN